MTETARRPIRLRMRVLVTGAAGLVGSGLAALLRRDRDVVGLDLRPGAEVALLADIARPPPLAGFAAVVHVAALHAPHVGRVPDAEFRAVNVEATERLLDAALAAGIGRFVFTSTTSLHGHALEPRDGRAAWIDEAVPPEPRDVYDETKLAAEALVRASGLSHAILRMSRCFPEPLPEMAVHRLHRHRPPRRRPRPRDRPRVPALWNVAGERRAALPTRGPRSPRRRRGRRDPASRPRRRRCLRPAGLADSAFARPRLLPREGAGRARLYRPLRRR